MFSELRLSAATLRRYPLEREFFGCGAGAGAGQCPGKGERDSPEEAVHWGSEAELCPC